MLFEDEIVGLGFKKTEAKVYLALLELGVGTVSVIAKKAGVNRTSTYDVIQPLVGKGLAKVVSGKNKQTYASEPMEKLIQYFDNQSRVFKDSAQAAAKLLPQLTTLTQRHVGQPKISSYEGSSGIKRMYEDTLLSSEDIRSWSSTDSLEEFDPKYLHGYYMRRAAKKVFIKAIISNSSSAREYQAKDKALYRELRIVPREMMDITPEVYVYDNKVAFFSLAEKLGVMIESWDIAMAMKKLFDLAWEKAGELNA